MRWNRLFTVCCSSLILMGFAGCKKVVKIDVDRSLAPLSATTAPGETLEWVATAPDETFDVVFDSGLCTQKSPIHASYGKSAVCTVGPQTFGPEKRQLLYTYSFEGDVGGKPFSSPKYMVRVAPGHCPHC
jgi:hypothetical protein